MVLAHKVQKQPLIIELNSWKMSRSFVFEIDNNGTILCVSLTRRTLHVTLPHRAEQGLVEWHVETFVHRVFQATDGTRCMCECADRHLT